MGALTLLGTGCNNLKSRDDLNQGVASYKNAKYSDAVSFFQEAISLDPNNPNARVYLATAYMMQWIPGAESPENLQFATKAKDEFGKVLTRIPTIPWRWRRWRRWPSTKPIRCRWIRRWRSSTKPPVGTPSW